MCKSFVRCHICNKGHHVILCPDLSPQKNRKSTSELPEVMQNNIANQMCSEQVTLMTLEVKVVTNKGIKKVRALMDCGSQKSYISEATVKELGLKAVSTENIAHSLFGGSRIEPTLHNKYSVKVRTKSAVPTNCTFDFLEQKIICSDIPRLPKGPLLKKLKRNRIWLSDMGQGCTKIDLLIGSNIYGRLLTGQVKQLKNGLTAVNTILGWTVCGQTDNLGQESAESNPTMLITNMALKEMKIQDLWKLETIGIMDTSEKLSRIEEDDLAYDHFIHDLKRNKDGRYCVGLPWISYQPDIPSNRHVAEKRLFSVTRKLKALNKLEDYSNVFVEWLEEGVIQKVPDEELELKGHYIPHHPVIKPESLTTKIRPVFDASCKIERTPSLNECLASGPNLIEQILSIFLRFREKAIGVIADIRRAFLQIEVKEEDRNYLKFLWWEKENKVQVFRHKRVVFGVTCSPFLLGAVIRHHLLNVPDKFVSVAKKLLESFYIDNCVASVEDGVQLKDFITKSTDIFSQAKMDLRMWQFGPLNIIDSDSIRNANVLQEEESTTVPVLGLKWDRKDDTLMIGSMIKLKTANLSKRGILSITQSIFDPIGLFIPVVLPAKLLIQKTWANKSGWDDPIPENIRDEFLRWYNALDMLNAIKIPRRVGYGDRAKWSIHVCCDASQKSYAAVIFLRCEEKR